MDQRLQDKVELLRDTKTIALFFGAQWCPMVQAMQNEMINHVRNNSSIGIIYVSSDMTEQELEAQRVSLGKGIPVIDFREELSRELKKRFQCWGGREASMLGDMGVQRSNGIPSLFIISDNPSEPLGVEARLVTIEKMSSTYALEWRHLLKKEFI